MVLLLCNFTLYFTTQCIIYKFKSVFQLMGLILLDAINKLDRFYTYIDFI